MGSEENVFSLKKNLKPTPPHICCIFMIFPTKTKKLGSFRNSKLAKTTRGL